MYRFRSSGLSAVISVWDLETLHQEGTSPVARILPLELHRDRSPMEAQFRSICGCCILLFDSLARSCCNVCVQVYAIAFEEHHHMTGLHMTDARPRVSGFAIKF